MFLLLLLLFIGSKKIENLFHNIPMDINYGLSDATLQKKN